MPHHRSELTVVGSELPNLGNTAVTAFITWDSTSCRSTCPLERKTRMRTRMITMTKVQMRNMPALFVASLMISASLLPLFLFSSIYSSNNLRSLSLIPSKSLAFIFFSFYYCFFLNSGSLAIFSFVYFIFAYLYSFYFCFFYSYFFLYSRCLLTACRSYGKNAKITIDVTTPIATPNIFILNNYLNQIQATHRTIQKLQIMFRIKFRFLIPHLALFSYQVPIKRVYCKPQQNIDKMKKKPQTLKLKSGEENITGARSLMSIIYVFLKRYYLSITKMTLRFWWNLFYNNAILVCSLVFLIFA